MIFNCDNFQLKIFGLKYVACIYIPDLPYNASNNASFIFRFIFYSPVILQDLFEKTKVKKKKKKKKKKTTTNNKTANKNLFFHK